MSHSKESQYPRQGLDRRQFLRSSGAAAVGLASASQIEAAKPSVGKSKPNLLFIITDQQHIDSIAAGGCPYVTTPAMDRLKRRSVSFVRSHAANPICGPSRSCLFTGRTASETSVCRNGGSIREGIPNLGQWFSQHSEYQTIYAGKWHVPSSFTHFIPGFEVINTGIGGQGNICDTSTSRACEAFLRNRTRTDPFLMVASFLQPHDICEWLRLNMQDPGRLRYPMLSDSLPPLPENFDFDPREPEHIKRTRLKNEASRGNWSKEHWRYYRWSYFRHVEQVDAEIGRILDSLEETGQDQNTAIVFTSDHGEGMGHHQMVRKSMPYDEALKVPLLISWPGHVLEDRTDDEHLVSGLDIFPTLCNFAGIEPPGNMRGMSLAAILAGKESNRDRFVVSEIPGNIGRVVRTPRYKFICYANDPVEQLFDMKKNPGETRNLVGNVQYAAVLEEHRQRLRQWERQLEVAPNIPNSDAWWRES